MNTLPQIQPHHGVNVVSARELYKVLEVKRDFTNWCKQMFEYGFTSNHDYWLAKIGERKAHNKTDYLLTLDTAKEIAMLQRTPVGKQVRNYFIEKEKGFNQLTEAIAQNQQKALERQKESFSLLQELQQLKAQNAQVFKRMSQIKKQLKANQTDTFKSLGLFQNHD